MKPDATLIRCGHASIGSTFRGTIWENCKRFRFHGKAYDSMPKEQNQHFWIETARHLMGAMLALLDPAVREVIVIGATQVLKSVLGDAWVPYCMEHIRRNMIVFFEDDVKAKQFADARLMVTIQHHPKIKDWIEEGDRHDATKTEVRVDGVTTRICGLNEGNASSLSWPLIWISEAWQHRTDGLLRKAIKRADRFPNDCKIFIESQAGMAGEDLHTEAQSAHQVPLTWACPRCRGRQTWEFFQERPSDFVPFMDARPSTFAGMIFDAGDDIPTRARSARWECYHCGFKIIDSPENRRQIMDSYEQDYQVAGPNGIKISPSKVCFVIPREAACGNSFESSVSNYLTAKSAEQAGNMVPLENWYMSERAVFYSPRLTKNAISVITSSYDAVGLIPDEAARVIKVDCQQGDVAGRTGKFWYVARAIDKAGNTTQLARGYAESWDEWIAVYRLLKIDNGNVFIDGGNYLQEILDKAAACCVVAERTLANGKKIKVRAVWKVLIGNGKVRSFPHDLVINGRVVQQTARSFSKPSMYQRQISIGNNQHAMLQIPVYNWSNISVKDHLFNLVGGGPGMPKFISLSRDKLTPATRAKEVNDLTYEKQMSNQYRTRLKGKDVWVESSPNVHYADCECGCLVAFDMGGCCKLPAVDAEV